jgi:1-pyrroline-5-carboxylate dehydrogenase
MVEEPWSALFDRLRSGSVREKDTAMEPFRNEAYSDFSTDGPRRTYQEALETVATKLGGHVPLVIGGKPVDTDGSIVSIDPARPEVVVGTTASASESEAQLAIDAARRAFPAWSTRPAADRAEIVHRIGDLMAERKFELSAWMTLEAGKNWAEAEADVAEAIDFCRYYAHEMVRLAGPVPVFSHPGEQNESFLVPMGAGVVIPPWNFPVAILVGMTVGPVVAGNTVVLKPASNTPILGAHFMDIVAEAGLPDGVINFLPGPGADVGDFLVDHPHARFINFTGSKEVGLRIAQRAAAVHPGQSWLKRAFMEMGGKDGIIVDETADLEVAADAIVRSAYGYQGQKCSACSRVIAVASIYDELIDRVVAQAAALEIGPAVENHPVGPVISAVQYRSILDEIQRGRDEARLVLGGQAVDRDGGYYIEPTIFTNVAPQARLAQHEIFGPVLSMIRVRDFTDALNVANGTEYGLTGGLCSTDPERIERATREFHVGNLYINRKITGALVGVQPFGGFKMSGSNAKAGGPDYIRLFMEMKTVATRL